MAYEFKMKTTDEIEEFYAEQEKTARDWEQLNKARNLEKTDLGEAILVYEGFVSAYARYPLPYMRLSVIYRKQKDYENEMRILQAALIVYAREGYKQHYDEAFARFEKTKALLLKNRRKGEEAPV